MSYRTIISAALVLLLQSCGGSGLPERYQLRDSWYFRYDSAQVGIAEEWYTGPVDHEHWRTVPAGSYWDEQYDGWGWYRQSVWLPEPKTDRSIALVITEVEDSARVWFNDSLLTNRSDQSGAFYTDIRTLYESGQENSIAILVEDSGGRGGLSGNVYFQKYLDERELLKTNEQVK